MGINSTSISDSKVSKPVCIGNGLVLTNTSVGTALGLVCCLPWFVLGPGTGTGVVLEMEAIVVSS